MTSINTNVSAMTALQSLSMINSNLDETQNRISTETRRYRDADAAYDDAKSGPLGALLVGIGLAP